MLVPETETAVVPEADRMEVVQAMEEVKWNGQSFDDFLKNGNQAEFDRRVNKAVETAVGKAREKWELLTNDKLSEAESSPK